EKAIHLLSDNSGTSLFLYPFRLMFRAVIGMMAKHTANKSIASMFWPLPLNCLQPILNHIAKVILIKAIGYNRLALSLGLFSAILVGIKRGGPGGDLPGILSNSSAPRQVSRNAFGPYLCCHAGRAALHSLHQLAFKPRPKTDRRQQYPSLFDHF